MPLMTGAQLAAYERVQALADKIHDGDFGRDDELNIVELETAMLDTIADLG